MDRSLFLARLMGPTFVAIALGMLINLGMYESMIAEALHTGIVFYLFGLLSLLAGLAIVNLHNMWRADWRVIITVMGWLMTIGGIIRIVLPQFAVAVGSTIYGGRTHLYYRGGADSWCAGRLPEFQGIRAARLRRGKAMTFELRMLALSVVLGRTSRACLACRELVTRLSQHRRSTRRGRAPVDLE